MGETRQLRSVSPVLLVADVVRAADYFKDKLGFAAPRFWGDPPTFTIARRDGVEVFLNQVDKDCPFKPNADYDGRFDAYFYVRDADALYAEMSANGADIVCPPGDEPYLMREFQVRDADGHVLAFGHDISEQAHG